MSHGTSATSDKDPAYLGHRYTETGCVKPTKKTF